jgi:carbohydrate binding protein with CBM4/9 domain
MSKKTIFLWVVLGMAVLFSPIFAQTQNAGLMREGSSTKASSSTQEMEAVKAFDKNIETQWRAASGNFPQHLMRSFANPIVTKKITTLFPEYYAYKYTIYASAKDLPSTNFEDKESWIKIVGPKVASGKVTDLFKAVKAKHFATKFSSLLSNASFEKPPKDGGNYVAADWQKHIRGEGTQALDLKIAHSGKASVKLTDANLQDNKGFHLYHQLIPVKPGSKYTFSVWARTEDGHNAFVGIRLDQMTTDKKWAQFVSNEEAAKRTKWGEFPLVSGKWKKFAIIAKTTHDCAYVRPGIFYYKRPNLKTNVFWVDDVSLIEGEDETDIAGILEQKIFKIKGE